MFPLSKVLKVQMSHTVRFFLTLVVLLSAQALTFAQVDPSKSLIGMWEGHISAANVPGGNQRTLMINSVQAKGENEWVALGRFGVTGQVKEGPGGQEMSVSSKNNETFIEFVFGPGKTPVRLKLAGDNKLQDTIGLFDRGRGVDGRITLEKIKAGETKSFWRRWETPCKIM
jgi:hypothetical protein